MIKYVALLRGINVGGNNIIKMAELKACFEKNKFCNVSTFIQSGNVIFESSESKIEELEKQIEEFLSKAFKYDSKVLVRSLHQVKKVLSQVPREWKNRSDLRCYVAFLKTASPQAAMKEIELREGIDSLKAGNGVLFMTTPMDSLSKSKFSKLASKKIYQGMTIRNYNTTRKIAELMEK